MNQEETKYLWVGYIPGAFSLILGMMLTLIFGSFKYINEIFIPLGIIFILIGIVLLYKAHSKIKKYKSKNRNKGYGLKYKTRQIITLMPILVPLLFGAVGLYAQSPGYSICYTAYQEVLYAEYALLSFVVVTAFLAFAPIILGRTPLGAIFSEFQGLAGMLLVLLIFLLLLVYPMDVMFNVSVGNYCTINIQNLETQGPPLLQIFLKLIIPPQPNFS